MSRPLRIEFKDAWYHVMNRGRRREENLVSRTDVKARGLRLEVGGRK
jgi:putative transposase